MVRCCNRFEASVKFSIARKVDGNATLNLLYFKKEELKGNLENVDLIDSNESLTAVS